MNCTLIQMIDIANYRLAKVLDTAADDYLDFQTGHGARTPRDILEHLIEVTFYGLSILQMDETTESGDCRTIICENLQIMKSHLSTNQLLDNTQVQLINGPLSDTLTHIGQLALLRRLSGDPIIWENYTLAKTQESWPTMSN